MKKFTKFLLLGLLSVMIGVSTLWLAGCKDSKIAPSSYKISAVYDAQNRTIDAVMTLNYTNSAQSELENVSFHLYPRAYREGAKFSPISSSDQLKAYPNGVSYGDMTIVSVNRDGVSKPIVLAGQDEDILQVEGNLAPNGQTQIEIDFRLELPTVRHRFGYYDGIVNLGNWFPIVCMHKTGGVCDTPYYSNGDPFFSDIANFDVSITTDSSLVVATSGRSTVTESEGRKTTSAQLENARDFAAVIGEFSVESKNHNGVEINYYYKTDEEPKKAVQTAADSLDTFSEMLGEYVYDSLSVVKTPFLHGGMEYPALIYISDIATGESFSEIIIHETAHQWWYAAVGSDQVNQAWLDEGLTQYTTTLFYEKNPSYGVDPNERLADSLATYLIYIENFKDNGRGDTSMNRSVADFANSIEYNVMTYIKGELMMDALRHYIGDESFFRGLKSYYSTYKLKIASGALFAAAMEVASKTDLGGFFDGWLNGKVKMYAS